MVLPSDEFLLAAWAKGDRDAFDRLAARYSRELDAFFRRRLPDDGRVEELRQETLLAVYALLPSYRETGRFRPLLFSIAYRKLVSARRSERPVVPLSERIAARETNPEAFEVRAAVDALPEGLREALLLTRFEGLTAAEAGSWLLGPSDPGAGLPGEESACSKNELQRREDVMTHEDYLLHLEAFNDSAEETEAVVAHVGGCASCSRDQRLAERALSALEPVRPPRFEAVLRCCAAAAIVIIVAVGILRVPQKPPEKAARYRVVGDASGVVAYTPQGVVIGTIRQVMR